VYQVKLGWCQNINTSRGFSALASTPGAFGNTGRASDSVGAVQYLYCRQVLVGGSTVPALGSIGRLARSLLVWVAVQCKRLGRRHISTTLSVQVAVRYKQQGWSREPRSIWQGT